jgi:hypothetical protein
MAAGTAVSAIAAAHCSAASTESCKLGFVATRTAMSTQAAFCTQAAF